ncbi:MAG: flagellar biosynthesis protein FlhA [Eubacteriales bacterium]
MKKMLDNMVTIFIISIIFLIIIPLSTVLLDMLLIFNIAISVGILLLTMNIKEPLEFSVFPSVLLITTLMRVALNISSTRLILGNGGFAGQVIKTFGEFVIGGNAVVGFIVFLIIIIVQFLVITKGAERVAEVAARFTLDAMPGKQMAIDADLNTGLINDETAKARRQKIQREADFYGSMDGATKFIKGDAIVSILILFINCIGGVIIGMVQGGGSFQEVLNKYIIATVGDGLVSQIPALLISTATGMVVTRAASVNSLSFDLMSQFTAYPTVLMITGGVLIAMSIIPGFPTLLLLLMGGGLIAAGFKMRTRAKDEDDKEQTESLPISEIEYYKNPEHIYSLLNVEAVEVEFGYSLIPLVDESKGGNFLNRVVQLRRQFATEVGMVIPSVSLRDNAELNMNEYIIKLKGEIIARGEVLADHYLVLAPAGVQDTIRGIETIEPAFKIPAKWITSDLREMAQMTGYTVIDPLSVIITHLSEIIRTHAHELLGRKDVYTLLDNLKKVNKELVEEVVPAVISHSDLQKVLCNLLSEGIPIKDLQTILETAGEYAGSVKDMYMLTEYVRQALKRTITHKYVQDGSLNVVTVNPDLENLILNSVKKSANGSYVSLDPDVLQRIVSSHLKEEKKIRENAGDVIILTSPVVRFYYKHLIEQFSADAVVLSFNEIESDINIKSLGTVGV